jgi:DNA-binding Xre family transcriptional regulator
MTQMLIKENLDDLVVLENISNCINDKMAILNIRLSDIARQAKIDYFTIRKIVNKEEDYLPNLRILIKLASFLNIKVGDLLNYNSLPQYVPIISKDKISDFLADNIKPHGFSNTIFCEKYIHKKAFAIAEPYKLILNNYNVTYVCYPSISPIINLNQIYLFKNNLNEPFKLLFGRVISMKKNGSIIVLNNNHNIELDNFEVIAIVVEVKMNENVI